VYLQTYVNEASPDRLRNLALKMIDAQPGIMLILLMSRLSRNQVGITLHQAATPQAGVCVATAGKCPPQWSVCAVGSEHTACQECL